ncbi:MAG: hypothetical protein Q7S32_01040 [bacterium]|nr:hypothetical protein [bacterium]
MADNAAQQSTEPDMADKLKECRNILEEITALKESAKTANDPILKLAILSQAFVQSQAIGRILCDLLMESIEREAKLMEKLDIQ